MQASSKLTRGLGLLVLLYGCSFPEYQYDDAKFYGQQGGTGNVPMGGTAGSGVGATGGTGAGGTGAGGTGVGATGGTGTGNENCTNGADDDNDQKIDCEDSDCQALYLCVPSTPNGWTGPVVYYEGNAPPGCAESGGYSNIKQTASSGFDAGAATCPSCSCGPASGLSCKAELVFFDAPSCAGSACWGSSLGCSGTQPITASSTCAGQNLCASGNLPASAAFTKPGLNGTCTATPTGSKNITTPKFTNTVRACGDPATTGQGCGTGSACLPKPKAPFSSNICIYQTGDVSCPGGAWAKKSVFHLSFADNRDCSACGCGSPTGACTNTSVELYTDTACSQGKDTLTVPETAGCGNLQADSTPIASPNCQGNAGASRSMKAVGTPPGSASCPPTGGQVTGSASPSEPITFCCI